MKKTPNQESIILLVFLGILSSFALFAWWQWYQKPLIKYEQYQRQQAAAIQQDAGKSSEENKKQANTMQADNKVDSNFNTSQDNLQSFINSINFNDSLLQRQDSINQTPAARVEFETAFVKGSINPKGLFLDDLTLKSYKQDLAGGNDGVSILSPFGFKNRGMIFYTLASDNPNITMPSLDTQWSLVKNVSLNGNALDLEFAWINPQGVKFIANIVTPDETNPYKFTVFYSVENNSGQDFNITTKGFVLKTFEDAELSQTNVASGFAGYADGKLQEHSFKDLKKTSQKTLCMQDVKNKDTGLKDSWLGLTEKYWFNGFFTSGKITCMNFEKITQDQSGKTFITSFVSEPAKIITGAESTAYSGEIFAGAKKIDTISSVAYKKYQLFDRIIDFGFLYILTKPLLLGLNLCNKITHNYGLSIILLTILLKFALYPLGKKSFKSISKIKKITPMIEELKKRHKDNRKALQADIASLYKTQGINPAAGCLPILLQIPFFIALYKVLFISIELRQAPFMFWITDLSTKDPLSIFNLFGLLPFNLPAFLQIGPLPILMGLSMYVQQRLTQQTQQAGSVIDMSFIKWLPLVFTIVFASLPSGLLIYWIVSNSFSILQQLYFDKIVYHKIADIEGVKKVQKTKTKIVIK